MPDHIAFSSWAWYHLLPGTSSLHHLTQTPVLSCCHLDDLIWFSYIPKAPLQILSPFDLGIELPVQENQGLIETIATEVSERISGKEMKIFCVPFFRGIWTGICWISIGYRWQPKKQSQASLPGSWLGLPKGISVTQRQLHHCKGDSGNLDPRSSLHRLWASTDVRVSLYSAILTSFIILGVREPTVSARTCLAQVCMDFFIYLLFYTVKYTRFLRLQKNLFLV